jgi:hypothetical protein
LNKNERPNTIKPIVEVTVRPLRYSESGDHGSDADEDAEHRQKRTQAIRPQSPHGASYSSY